MQFKHADCGKMAMLFFTDSIHTTGIADLDQADLLFKLAGLWKTVRWGIIDIAVWNSNAVQSSNEWRTYYHVLLALLREQWKSSWMMMTSNSWLSSGLIPFSEFATNDIFWNWRNRINDFLYNNNNIILIIFDLFISKQTEYT